MLGLLIFCILFFHRFTLIMSRVVSICISISLNKALPVSGLILHFRWNVILRYIYQQQGCGSSHAQISTRFEGGNDKNVQCGPPISSAMMHEDCQSENTG
ncbi:hypothetical protein D8674_004737 [Pyrus ussuriensis x Pyrus communis]|uniref:Uncharacterized protein n=1 Tax=Pyrus ussuriensis x Pyrus communis TaxID=2448454 RepID=A0A5N5FC61_9ROSA|nr:hypothetical protein D8674_038417 [Pyrus ussuriensis x Pyrus communis]KAB2603732.1 hypothetical protein D8674_004737 [Pyrus ussuriensis x Pyrus communis]